MGYIHQTTASIYGKKFSELTNNDILFIACHDKRCAKQICKHLGLDIDLSAFPDNKIDVESILLKYDLPDPAHPISRQQRLRSRERYNRNRDKHKAYYLKMKQEKKYLKK